MAEKPTGDGSEATVTPETPMTIATSKVEMDRERRSRMLGVVEFMQGLEKESYMAEQEEEDQDICERLQRAIQQAKDDLKVLAKDSGVAPEDLPDMIRLKLRLKPIFYGEHYSQVDYDSDQGSVDTVVSSVQSQKDDATPLSIAGPATGQKNVSTGDSPKLSPSELQKQKDLYNMIQQARFGGQAGQTEEVKRKALLLQAKPGTYLAVKKPRCQMMDANPIKRQGQRRPNTSTHVSSSEDELFTAEKSQDQGKKDKTTVTMDFASPSATTTAATATKPAMMTTMPGDEGGFVLKTNAGTTGFASMKPDTTTAPQGQMKPPVLKVHPCGGQKGSDQEKMQQKDEAATGTSSHGYNLPPGFIFGIHSMNDVNNPTQLAASRSTATNPNTTTTTTTNRYMTPVAVVTQAPPSAQMTLRGPVMYSSQPGSQMGAGPNTTSTYGMPVMTPMPVRQTQWQVLPSPYLSQPGPRSISISRNTGGSTTGFTNPTPPRVPAAAAAHHHQPSSLDHMYLEPRPSTPVSVTLWQKLRAKLGELGEHESGLREAYAAEAAVRPMLDWRRAEWEERQRWVEVLERVRESIKMEVMILHRDLMVHLGE